LSWFKPWTWKLFTRKTPRGSRQTDKPASVYSLTGSRASEDAGRLFRNEPPYGPPMNDAVASGNLNHMRQVRAAAQNWLSAAEAELVEIRTVLRRLDAAISDLEAR
jgi:Domain of unknown function (DUF1843)